MQILIFLSDLFLYQHDTDNGCKNNNNMHYSYKNVPFIDNITKRNHCLDSYFIIKYWEINDFEVDITGKLENIPINDLV